MHGSEDRGIRAPVDDLVAQHLDGEARATLCIHTAVDPPEGHLPITSH